MKTYHLFIYIGSNGVFIYDNYIYILRSILFIPIPSIQYDQCLFFCFLILTTMMLTVSDGLVKTQNYGVLA